MENRLRTVHQIIPSKEIVSALTTRPIASHRNSIFAIINPIVENPLNFLPTRNPYVPTVLGTPCLSETQRARNKYATLEPRPPTTANASAPQTIRHHPTRGTKLM